MPKQTIGSNNQIANQNRNLIASTNYLESNIFTKLVWWCAVVAGKKLDEARGPTAALRSCTTFPSTLLE